MLFHDYVVRDARVRDGDASSSWPTRTAICGIGSEIAEGRDPACRGALALEGRGPYVLQAAIAAEHTEDGDQDWVGIAALYAELTDLSPSPVVALNRAIAVAESEGPEAGLALLEELDLEEYRYLHSTRAELHSGDWVFRQRERAAAAYRRALELVDDDAERPAALGAAWPCWPTRAER